MPRSSYFYGILLVVFFIAGCGKFDVVNQPPVEINNCNDICIVKNNRTKEGFRLAMQEWLVENGYTYKLYPNIDTARDCEWMLTYKGAWSWDIGIFLSHANISAYENGRLAGYVDLTVGQWDAHKFEKGDVRVKKMMDMLYSKVDYYVLPKPKKLAHTER